MDALNRILLPPSVPELRNLRLADGRRAASQDASFLPYIVEEMVRYSAAELAIDPDSFFYDSLELLPRAYRSRVVRVDKRSEATELTRAVLAPMLRDLDIPFVLGSVTLEPGKDEEGLKAQLELGSSLRTFLVGVYGRTQVELDPGNVIDAILRLRASVHSPDALANLAVLEGVFRSYEPIEISTLDFRAEPDPTLAKRFDQFIQDETYVEMSREAGLLGVPARMTRAVIFLQRAAERLILKPRFRGTVDLTSTSISAAVPAPLPRSTVLADILVRQSYLPPLVSLRTVNRRAHETWKAAAPPFIPPRRDSPLFGAVAVEHLADASPEI